MRSSYLSVGDFSETVDESFGSGPHAATAGGISWAGKGHERPGRWLRACTRRRGYGITHWSCRGSRGSTEDVVGKGASGMMSCETLTEAGGPRGAVVVKDLKLHDMDLRVLN